MGLKKLNDLSKEELIKEMLNILNDNNIFIKNTLFYGYVKLPIANDDDVKLQYNTQKIIQKAKELIKE